MPTENVKKLKRTYEAWRAGGPQDALPWLDPDVVWTAIEDAPDAGVYRGHAGVLSYMTTGCAIFRTCAWTSRS